MSEKAIPAPTLYAIDEKSEPLLASVKRLKLFMKGEEEDITSFDPKRKDCVVCRLNKEGKTVKVDKMTGAQLREAYTIAAAFSEEDKLDAQAKKELAAALAKYQIHTFNEKGEITASRDPKSEQEAIDQVQLDVNGAHHFRKLVKKAQGITNGRLDDSKKEKVGEGSQSRSSIDNGNVSTIAENIRLLEATQLAGAQLATSMETIAGKEGGDFGSLTFRNARVGMGKKSLVS